MDVDVHPILSGSDSDLDNLNTDLESAETQHLELFFQFRNHINNSFLRFRGDNHIVHINCQNS